MKTHPRIAPVKLPQRRNRPKLELVGAHRSTPFRREEYPGYEQDASGDSGSGVQAKRAVDLIGAAVLFIATAPFMVLTAILVKLTSRGPIVYKQTRLTQGGKVFTIYKFRTMRSEAERKSGPVFAQENDPRITPIGKFLRKTRLDELPQLFNVFAGDMSLVGPRPERPELAKELQRDIPGFHARLKAKAGLTGLAQVRQGYPDGIEGYRRKLAWDRVYIRNRSVLLDCWIAVKTVSVVLTGSGAR
jgi:lipopolysaccharide/colanic/teichoic acid biosynthesis glycosyltransferase